MNTFFDEYNDTYFEKFEEIFDEEQTTEKAKQRALSLYIKLLDSEISIDPKDIIDIADDYGHDLSDFEQLAQQADII